MPNVVKCMGSADIIQQYKAYCQENNIMQLGDSTMFRILEQCGAQVRKSLECLDYFVAEGGRAFVTLQDVIDKLLSYQVISGDQQKDYQALLLQSKQYLRTDFKIHVSHGSEEADHCMVHALSDAKEGTFMEECRHCHDMGCESCEQLKDLLTFLENIFSNSSIIAAGEEINDLRFKVQRATESIWNLKKHAIRCKNQDQAKRISLQTCPLV
ncbi:uncharacterized protein LOC134247668 [Saccostrea cucullata]|uniref:uncharacterized protein LOC134247668 n=1 Tax=Saccostrea cuccullata TaxID=36930 RepID=UPI002ED2E744